MISGILLLFFAIVVAEVTETSDAAASEKSGSQKAALMTGTTILTRVYENQSSAGDDDGRDVDPTKRRTHDDSESGSSRDESASNRDGDKDENAASMRSDATKSSDESDDGSSDGGKRHGEISGENSGKSWSAKAAVSDDSLGLARTNELTAATAKPALNDSRSFDNEKKNLANITLVDSSNREGTSSAGETAAPVKKGNTVDEQQPRKATSAESTERTEKESLAKREERKNVTVLNEKEETVTSVASPLSGDAVVKPEKKGKLIKSDHEESISKIEPRKDDEATGSKGNAEENRKSEWNRDRESITVRGVQREDSPREDSKEDEANDLGTTASEAVDLKKIDEKDHGERTVSLINDTHVNHLHRTLTEKDRRAGSSVNRTADANPGSKGNPKTEVEVVKNVTHQPILKIVATDTNDTAKDDSRLNAVNEEAVHGNSDAVTDEDQRTRADATTIDDGEADERRRSMGQPESQVKLAETTTPSARSDEEHTSSSVSDRATTASPVPQGRTIGLSVVNEFPSIEMKPTSSTKDPSSSEATSSAPHGGVTPSSKTERIDRKPYPYVKSSREPLRATTAMAGLKLESGEETSAYENTIGKGESEKKIVIVTEPSVVIENSIQQQKPNERPDESNVSTNSTTASPSASVTTSGPTVSTDVGSTNATLPEGSNGNAEMTASGSNVPGVKEEEKVTARRDDEGYDVTGNGITEVSSLAPDGGKPVKSRSGTATESSRAASTNTDIQMEPEEALMIRSSLDVTESTIVPPDKGGASEAKSIATTRMTPTTGVDTTDHVATMVLENSTEPTPKTNVTTERPSSTTTDRSNAELPSAGITLNPDESSIPTTTSVEFEFVELTEAAVSSASNATERQSFEEQTTKTTIATSVESSASTNNSTAETITTARIDESTEFAATTTENGTPTTNQVSVTYHADNETIEVKNLPPVTSRTSAEDRNNRTESVSNEITVNPIDFTSAGTTAGAYGITDDPSGSKDPNYDANVTRTSPPAGVVVTMNVTKSPPASFSTSGTLEPRVLWSTPAFVESFDEETTDGIQPFSSEDITYVKIIIEGTLHDVCPRLQDLKQALADVLTNGVDK